MNYKAEPSGYASTSAASKENHGAGIEPDGLKRVLQWFAEGRLQRPRSTGRPDIVDLIKAIARTCGAAGIEETPKTRRVCDLIGAHEHVVFVLIDGLGARLLQQLSGRCANFFTTQLAGELESVYPSTTAVALTALGTAAYPAQHALPGWWVYFEELNATAEILPFVERFSKRPFAEFGATSEMAFNASSVLPRLAHAPLVVTRSYIVNSTYSRYWSGGSPGAGYDTIHEGVDKVIERVKQAAHATYTHLYLPQLDALCHHHGIEHDEVQKVFALLEGEMVRLHSALKGKARLIISADHGHVQRETDRHLQHDDALLRLLRCPPSGEPTVPIFHVLPGAAAEFKAAFHAEFGDLFALLSIDQVDALELLGPGRLSPAARRHYGDFIGIAPAPYTLHYMNPAFKTIIHRGVHAGMTPAEMTVPLIIA